MVFDMTDLYTRKRVIVIMAKAALGLEVRGMKTRGPSVLRRMQMEDMGFKSKTKVKMLAEVTAWLDNEHAADRRENEADDMDMER